MEAGATVVDQHADTSPTRIVGGFSLLPELIHELGGNPSAILDKVGLAEQTLASPSNRIGHCTLLNLLDESATALRCPHFGLLAGQKWHMAHLGLLGELLRNSATVGEALQELVVNQHLNSEGALAFLVERGRFVDLGYAIYQAVGGHTLHLYDAALAVGVNLVRELHGTRWTPAEVFFAHHSPADTTPYRAFFGAPVHFDSEFTAIRFPADTLSHPVAHADPALLRLARTKVMEADRRTLSARASRALRHLLLQGMGSGEDIARSLAIHRRTLNRRLQAEGTTFQELLDGVRCVVAKELLEGTEIPMPEIAAALGYGSVPSFNRAFRRWTGHPPGLWRKFSVAQRA